MTEGIGPAPEEIVVDSDVALTPVMPGDSQAMFNIINSDRAFFSQFGDKTAAKYPTLAAMQERNTHQAPNERRFAIRHDGEIVGFVKLTDREDAGWEIGYWMDPRQEGHGYMTRGARALTDYGFTRLGARRIFANVVAENFRSRAVVERLGYQFEGRNPNDPTEVVYAKTPPTA